jgi:hypothetical protein
MRTASVTRRAECRRIPSERSPRADRG